MAKKKLRIGILFGGRSGEHEISLLSAASILKAIDRKKYEVVALGITKQGQWVRDAEAQQLLTGEPAPLPPGEPAVDDPELAVAAAVIRSGEPLSIPAPKPHAPASFQTLDLVALRFACRLNGVDAIALTKLDILTNEPEIPVCVAYELDGTRIDTVPATLDELVRLTPVYERLPEVIERPSLELELRVQAMIMELCAALLAANPESRDQELEALRARLAVLRDGDAE